MDIEGVKQRVEQVLSADRYQHTLRVMDTALALAEQYKADAGKVAYAALLHDYAKCFTIDELKKYIIHYKLPQALLHYHFELWHGPVGAKIAEIEFGIKDEDILHAIYYHTTGRKHMTRLEYIIFVADYIEPARSFPGVQEVRALAKNDLRIATRAALKNTIIYLMKKDSVIHPDSFGAYNMLTETKKER